MNQSTEKRAVQAEIDKLEALQRVQAEMERTMAKMAELEKAWKRQ